MQSIHRYTLKMKESVRNEYFNRHRLITSNEYFVNNHISSATDISLIMTKSFYIVGMAILHAILYFKNANGQHFSHPPKNVVVHF